MRQYLFETTFLSACMCTLSADITAPPPTQVLMSARTCPGSQTQTINPSSSCNIERPQPIVTIHPCAGFCTSVPDNDNTNPSRRMIPQSDDGKRQEKNLQTELNVDESETTLSAKIANFSRLYPALHENIGESWFLMLENQFTIPYFTLLSKYLVRERRRHVVFPPEDEVWTWTRMCSVQDVKVVIVGSQPCSRGQGHGLSYSVRVGIKPTGTLLNIYKELTNDIQGFVAPSHGYLVGWARQGILLLNYILTVRSHASSSHTRKGWELLTVSVLRYLNNNARGIVFIYWGRRPMWQTKKFLNLKYHYVLQATHPHPITAHRGFFGCKHFSLCNKMLISRGKKPINWSYLPLE